ncbi:MAG TPA: DUF3488 domain-containing protein, partial [Chthoniobacteraceae bacterium]|nr:DUF3488 domain-containing protein [Chthoniobacteraceae bacterium]
MKAGKQEIPRRPMLWLTTGLLFTVPPMIGTLSAWVWAAFAAALVAKFWMERRGWRLRSVLAKLALSGCILGGVKLTYGSLGGLEPLLSLFLLYVSLKVLEAHTARDFHIQALVGWLLCLSGLFNSQNLLPGIYAITGFVLILSAVVQFHRGASSRKPVSGPLLTSGALVLRALPVVTVLFFFFPRISAFQFHLSRRSSAQSGMSGDLKPGSISSLALSNDIAFRAEFPDGNMPAIGNLYWRGAVLTQDDGLSWRP